MSALTRFFFRAPYSLPKTGDIVRWWESRRLPYNLAVGSAGVLSLAVVALFDILPPSPKVPGIPWGGILVYAILANVFFSLGPVVDTVICRKWGRDYAELGPTIFRYGFAFAVGLTLLPVPLAIITYIGRFIGGFW